MQVKKILGAGDATSRGVRLADKPREMVYLVFLQPQWGFYDISYNKTNKDQKLKDKSDQILSLIERMAVM